MTNLLTPVGNTYPVVALVRLAAHEQRALIELPWATESGLGYQWWAVAADGRALRALGTPFASVGGALRDLAQHLLEQDGRQLSDGLLTGARGSARAAAYVDGDERALGAGPEDA